MKRSHRHRHFSKRRKSRIGRIVHISVRSATISQHSRSVILYYLRNKVHYYACRRLMSQQKQNLQFVIQITDYSQYTFTFFYYSFSIDSL